MRTAGAAIGLVAALAAAAPASAALQRKQPPLTTPWTEQVSTTAPLPEYPRPQLRRSRWLNLNGQWQFAAAAPGEAPPFGRRLPETILVPFPMQSALSGIARYEPRSWYRRTFRVPAGWRGRRLLLHFGAVTHRAVVYVNGRRAGAHAGSYDAFTLDVTALARRDRVNELVVGVEDDLVAGGHPTGKQFPSSVAVFFTAASGIWQTVWLEPVARAHVTRLDLDPQPERGRLLVRARVEGGAGTRVVVRARDGRRVVARSSAPGGRPLALRMRRAKRWTPERPFLYGLDVEVRAPDGRVLDRARSYAGMRSVRVGRVDGRPRILLNGRPVFHSGTLDQGYWPDGVYTAPTDAALRFDLQAHKRMGFNMVRKHIKVEPQRWYHWADRLGLLVWQDMPSMPIYRPVAPDDERQFERELREMIAEHRSSPSIVSWVPFNEGWGEFDVERITALTKRLDRSRVVNGHSGGVNCCAAQEPRGGDVRDSHLYGGPWSPPPDGRRALVTGEFGAPIVRTPGHEWDPARPQPAAVPRAALPGLLRRQWDALGQALRTPGLSGAVFTELTDVEQELAGLLTFDRRIFKVDPALVRRLNRRLLAASRRADGVRPQRAAVPAGTTALWTLDEGRGTVARGRGPRARALALRGASWTDGVRGRALRVRRGASAGAPGPVVDASGSFTVSAWLRHEDARQTAAAVSQPGAAGPGLALGLLFGTQRPDTLVGYEDTPAREPTTGLWWTFDVPGAAANLSYGDHRFAPRAGTWHHVVGVRSRADRTLALFVDGEPADHRSVAGAIDASGAFAIGGGFDGAVDQLRTYDRALSAAEVWRLHAAERPAGR